MLRRFPGNLLRARRTHDDSKVAFVELFFDLVFVFAITQLSHMLLHDFTLAGAGKTVLLFLAVWWVWIYTSWVTNWLDPQKTPVRLMLYALMLAGLVMSMSIPQAYGERGLAFAAAFAFMQVGRSLFTLWALAGRDPGNFRNFQRITCWLALSSVFWLAGGFTTGETRIALWIAALAIEYASPAAGFWTPRLGRSTTADWQISGAHMAERCGLFIIICLGESILVSGVTFAGLDWTATTSAAFTITFLGTVAMWWVYFHIGHERASRLIERSSDPGRLGRLAYTYLHIPIVAGIILTATAAEFLLAHPTGHTEDQAAVAMLGGPALFLLGNLLFKRCSVPRPPLSHMVGLAMLGLLIIAVPRLAPIALGAAAMAVLIIVAVWERISLGPGSKEPPLEV